MFYNFFSTSMIFFYKIKIFAQKNPLMLSQKGNLYCKALLSPHEFLILPTKVLEFHAASFFLLTL